MKSKKKVAVICLVTIILLSGAAIMFAPPIIIHSQGILIGKKIDQYGPYSVSVSSAKAYARNKFENLIFFNWWRDKEIKIYMDEGGILKPSSFREKYEWLWLNDKDKDGFFSIYVAKVEDQQYVFVYSTP